MFTDWFNKLSVIFEGYRGLVSFAVFVGGLFVLEMFTKVLDGGTAFIVYAFFLAFMISWVYFATGQHNKPKV